MLSTIISAVNIRQNSHNLTVEKNSKVTQPFEKLELDFEKILTRKTAAHTEDKQKKNYLHVGLKCETKAEQTSSRARTLCDLWAASQFNADGEVSLIFLQQAQT